MSRAVRIIKNIVTEAEHPTLKLDGPFSIEVQKKGNGKYNVLLLKNGGVKSVKEISESFISEKEYTDSDAIKDYQRMISKDKERILALKKDIKDDQEMIKDKTQKMNDADDADLKKRYAANIEKIKARIKSTEASIKEWQEDIKVKEKKLADAKSDLSKKESLSEEKDPKIKKMEDEVKKLKEIKDDAFEKMMKEKEKYGSSDAWFHQDIVSYRKLHDAHSDANDKWDKAYFKLQKMKGNR